MVVYLFFLVGGEPKKTMAAGAPGVISTPVRFLKGVYIYNIYIYIYKIKSNIGLYRDPGSPSENGNGT